MTGLQKWEQDSAGQESCKRTDRFAGGIVEECRADGVGVKRIGITS